VVRRRIGSLQAEEACHALPKTMRTRAVLAVDAERSQYTFLYGSSERDLQVLGSGETRYLSTEVAGGFTGVYFALYATGNGIPCQQPADFDWFRYAPRDAPSETNP